MNPKQKKAGPAPNEPEVVAADPQALASEVYSAALTAIRDEIRGIAAGKIKPEGHDPASRIAWLGANATKIAAEDRKAKAAAAAELKRFDVPTIERWAKQQTRDVRAQLVAAITALDGFARKSVLG